VHKGAQMEKFITRYSQTYILVGELELILRARLIVALSRYSLEKGYAEWYQVLDQKTAFEPDKPSASFSLWRDVLSQRNFTKLWLPCTRFAFLDLPFAESFKTYQKVDNRMHYAVGTRNRICHFNFANYRNVKHEEANLIWLIKALGEDAN
jgi:hypothetical protein